MSGELVPQSVKAEKVRKLFEDNLPQIAAALPKHMSASRFVRIALTSFARTPGLLDCSQGSLYGSILTLAQLGLEPDDLRGLAYLIPFKNTKKGVMEVTIIIGYQGLIDLATRDRKVSYMRSEVVYEKDQWEYHYGSGSREYYEHTPSDLEDPGPAIAVYCKAVFPNGQDTWKVLLPRDINKIKTHSQAVRYKSGPWITHEDQMWMKSAARALCKWLPKSAEVSTAVALDERADAGLPQDLQAVFSMDHIETKAARPRLDALAEDLNKGQNGEEDRIPEDKPPVPVKGTPGPKPKAKEEGKLSADDISQNLINTIQGADMQTLLLMEDNIKESIQDMPPHLKNKVISVWGNKKVELRPKT